MSYPLFLTNLAPVKWSEVSLSNLNPTQKRVELKNVKNASAKDVSDGTEPEAELHFPVKMQDHSQDIKSVEYADYTISIDKNNAPKVDDELEVTKVKMKLREGLVGAYITLGDTIVVYTNPLKALQECSDPSALSLVSFDLYEHVSWDGLKLQDLHRKLLSESTDHTDRVNHLVVQYHGTSKRVDTDGLLQALRADLKCPELTMDSFNPNVTSGKLWFSCPYGSIPSELPTDLRDSILSSATKYVQANDAYVVNRTPVKNDDTI